MPSQSNSRRIWILVVKLTGVAYLLAWLGYFATSEHFDATRPSKPEAGRAIAQNNHGHVVYLTQSESSQLRVLQDSAIGLFLVAVVAAYFAKRKGAEELPR